MGSSWNVAKLNSAWLRAMQIFLFHIPINYRSTVSVFVLKCTITGDTNKPFFFQRLELKFLKYHMTHLADLKHAPVLTCVALEATPFESTENTQYNCTSNHGSRVVFISVPV